VPESLTEWLFWPYATVLELIRAGGPFVSAIFVCGWTLWALVVERIWYFSRVLPRQADGMLAQWRARSEHNSWRARAIRRAMISRLNGAMTVNLPLLRTLVPLAPLLGLVGTVSGMLEVFDAMALRGSADARTMANGVSHAMICTMTGLVVSITGLYPVYYFQSRARRETELLADHFEL
jgi:biopolymer transport protein ExbB